MCESIVYRVWGYVVPGAAGGVDCLCDVWFSGEERARAFAEAMLLDIHREVVVGFGDPRVFWCELVAGRRGDSGWRPDGPVRVARLDSPHGLVDWRRSPELPRPRAGSV